MTSRHLLALEMPLVAVEMGLLGGIQQDVRLLARGKPYRDMQEVKAQMPDVQQGAQQRQERTRLLRRRLLGAAPGTRLPSEYAVDSLLLTKERQSTGWLNYLSLLYDWQATGRRVYHIDADAMERLRELTLTGVALSKVELPLSAFAVQLPYSLFSQQGNDHFTVLVAPPPFEQKRGLSVMLLPTPPTNSELAQRLSSRDWRSRFCGNVERGRFSDAWMMVRRFDGLVSTMPRFTFDEEMFEHELAVFEDTSSPTRRALWEAICTVIALSLALAAGKSEGIVLDGDKPKGTGTERPVRPPVVRDPSTIADVEDICVVKHEHIVRLSQALARQRARSSEPAYEVEYHTRRAYKRRRPGEPQSVEPSIQVGPPGGIIEVRKDRKLEGQAAPGLVSHVRV